VGNSVRLNKIQRTFEKEYLPGWTEEMFVVHRVMEGVVPTYKIRERDDTPVEGTFYKQHLQKVHVPTTPCFALKRYLGVKKGKSWSSGKGGPTSTTVQQLVNENDHLTPQAAGSILVHALGVHIHPGNLHMLN